MKSQTRCPASSRWVVAQFVCMCSRFAAKQGPNPIPCHVKKPGEFNEDAFRALDKVLEVANRVGVRVIIPLVDNWKWWGGAEQYAEYHGKHAADFWTDPEIIADFKKTIELHTQPPQHDTPARSTKTTKRSWPGKRATKSISPYSWTKEIAAYLKSLDTNHLVWDGFYIGNQRDSARSARRSRTSTLFPVITIPGRTKVELRWQRHQTISTQQIAGKKVYVVGEFGFIPVSGVEKVLDTVISEGAVRRDDLEPALSQSRWRFLLALRSGQRECLQGLSLSWLFDRHRLTKRAHC